VIITVRVMPVEDNNEEREESMAYEVGGEIMEMS
jgi:hypothetical protein